MNLFKNKAMLMHAAILFGCIFLLSLVPTEGQPAARTAIYAAGGILLLIGIGMLYAAFADDDHHNGKHRHDH